MSFNLSRVFSKSSSGEQWPFHDSSHIPMMLAREAYYRYLFPGDRDTRLTVPQKLVVDVTLQSLQKKEVRNKAVPRLPHVIPKLLQSLRDPDSSARDYVDIINKDPVMATAVLRLANSVYFNPIGRRIHELDQAVVKLGIEGLRSVLSAAVMQPIIQKDSAYFSHSGQRIWQHSLCTAVACEQIAEHRRVDKFKVYVLGLVHDVGKITLFSELSKQYKLNGETESPGYQAFVPPLKRLSCALSYWIAKDWDLPKELCQALAEQVSIENDQPLSEFGHILAQANLITEIYSAIYPSKPRKAEAVLEELDLPRNLFHTFRQLTTEL